MTGRRSGKWGIACCWLAAAAALAETPRVVAQTGVTGDTLAPQTDTQSDALFIKLDKNHDGYLSEIEARGEVPDFGAADSNGDSRVDPTEFEAARNTHSAPEGDEVEPDETAS